MPGFKWPSVQYAVTPLGGGTTPAGVAFPGGLDLVTPSLRLQPGALRDMLNFECAQSGGYSRIQGYERLDGRTPPSSATYRIVQVDAFANTPTAGQTITQAVSGTTAVVLAVVAYPPYMVVTKTTGAFDTSHAITTAGIAVGTAVPQTVSIDAKTDAIYTAAAADNYRADIGAVPGSGAVLGVVGMVFGGIDCVFAFRANAGGTAVNLYKASTSGWTRVPFFNTVDFTAGGTAVPADGDTLTQGGVTATIERVMWQSGGWTGSAAGTFVVTDPSGGNFAAGAATTSSGATVTLSGAQTAITMLPGGHFEFVKCNFSGQLATRRIYGCDGVNKCFEFDGTTLAPIATGASPDRPSHICFHKNYLFVSQESSIMHCGVATPFKWNSTDGGGEIATGDTVTGMLTLPGSQTTATLGVWLSGNASFLYGTDPSSFNYVSFNTGIGALPYSVQNLFDTFAFDSLGAITLRTTLNWGNFLPTTLTKNILPWIEQERGKLVESSVMRGKSQYRLFFSDGYGLWLTMINQQYLGAAIVQFPNPVSCVDEDETSVRSEVTYFGSSDGLGFVYQMDAGTSFDGQPITAYITTAWNPVKSPRVLKRFRAASVEVQGTGYTEFNFGYSLGYGSPLISQPNSVPATLGFQGIPYWDSFVWDRFVWDGQTLTPADVDATGTGENVQISISCVGNYIPAFTVNSVIFHYTPRRGIRV